MLTKAEFDALILVLQRAPINNAEALAIDAIIRKLMPETTPTDPSKRAEDSVTP